MLAGVAEVSVWFGSLGLLSVYLPYKSNLTSVHKKTDTFLLQSNVERWKKVKTAKESQHFILKVYIHLTCTTPASHIHTYIE